jgi:hypothetical protein
VSWRQKQQDVVRLPLSRSTKSVPSMTVLTPLTTANQRYQTVAHWHKSGFNDFQGKSTERFPAKAVYRKSLHQTANGGTPAVLLLRRIARQ